MKDYKEMTESVLQQANARAAQRTRQRRMATGLIAVTLCFAILIAVVGFGVGRNPAGTTQPTISMENPTTAPTTQPEVTEPTQQELPLYTGQVYFLSGEEDTGILTPMQANMTFATETLFRFRSYKGMTDAEKYQASLEELAFLSDFRDKYQGNEDGLHIGMSRSEEYFAMTLSGGNSSLVMPDASIIESSELETNGVFHVDKCILRYKKTVTFEEGENTVVIPEGCYRIHLHIRMSDESFKMIRENPDLKYSTLKDTITVTVRYKDGTKAVAKIDVTMNDEGYFFLSMRNSNASV
jgi:hypothetical protein